MADENERSESDGPSLSVFGPEAETAPPLEFDLEAPTEVMSVELVVPPSFLTDQTETAAPCATGFPDEPAVGPDRIEALVAMIVDLDMKMTRRLDGLATAFEREVRAEATREKIVDRLHDELQQYKGDLLLGTLRPVLLDLIQLHDDIGKVAVSSQVDVDGGPGAEVSRLLGLMRGFQQGIEDILYRQGVEPFEVDGDAFDPKRQRAITTVPTEDPALARTVAGRLRTGFASGDKVIRPELVSVRKLVPAASPGTATPTSERE